MEFSRFFPGFSMGFSLVFPFLPGFSSGFSPAAPVFPELLDRAKTLALRRQALDAAQIPLQPRAVPPAASGIFFDG
jgi:hypothetical protein